MNNKKNPTDDLMAKACETFKNTTEIPAPPCFGPTSWYTPLPVSSNDPFPQNPDIPAYPCNFIFNPPERVKILKDNITASEYEYLIEFKQHQIGATTYTGLEEAIRVLTKIKEAYKASNEESYRDFQRHEEQSKKVGKGE